MKKKLKKVQAEQRILVINERGQLTIPKADRDALGTRYFLYIMEGKNVLLQPLQTRDEFLRELDEAEEDWKKNGGFTLKEMRQRHHL